MERKQSKPPKPLKLLANLFQKSKRANANESEARSRSVPRDRSSEAPHIVTSGGLSSLDYDSGQYQWMDNMSGHCTTPGLDTSFSAAPLYTEMEALHLSRQDNPVIQKMASQENLEDLPMADRQSLARGMARCYSQSAVASAGGGGGSALMSPEPPYSPTKSCGDAIVLSEDLHEHLIRSPPPMNWPEPPKTKGNCTLSPRSNGTFSPESSDGLDLEYQPCNYYTRSQSEEHILSPCRDLLRAGMMSPTRGTTPELLMTTSMHQSPKSKFSGSSRLTGTSSERRRVRRNHTFNSSSSHFSPERDSSETDAMLLRGHSPYRNQTSFDGLASTPLASHSTYTMSSSMSAACYGGSGLHLSTDTRSASGSRKKAGSAYGSKKSSGDSFFTNWRARRSRRASENTSPFILAGSDNDAKSMENLQSDDVGCSSVAGGPSPFPNPRMSSLSPSARKSLCSISGLSTPGGFSGSNRPPTLFTRYRVKDEEPLFVR